MGVVSSPCHYSILIATPILERQANTLFRGRFIVSGINTQVGHANHDAKVIPSLNAGPQSSTHGRSLRWINTKLSLPRKDRLAVTGPWSCCLAWPGLPLSLFYWLHLLGSLQLAEQFIPLHELLGEKHCLLASQGDNRGLNEEVERLCVCPEGWRRERAEWDESLGVAETGRGRTPTRPTSTKDTVLLYSSSRALDSSVMSTHWSCGPEDGSERS